jgi:hypothetical protein
VRDEHEGRFFRSIELEKKAEDAFSRFHVEVADRFVGEKHFGAVDERARDSHALLFPARQLGGKVVQAMRKPDAVEKFLGPFAGAAPSQQFERNHRVFQGGQRRKKAETLKNKSDRLAAEARAFFFGKAVYDYVVDADGPFLRKVQPGAEAEQRRLAAPGGTHHGAGRSDRKRERDAFQNRQRFVAAQVTLGQSVGFDRDVVHDGILG